MNASSSGSPRAHDARPGTTQAVPPARSQADAPCDADTRPAAPPQPAATSDTGTTRPAAPPQPAATSGIGTHPAPVSQRFLARATLVTAALSIAGALFGLVRDQSLARLFGAGQDTDAFLVAWTVPEFAATLLIEDGLAFALVPAFSVALARRAEGVPGDPVRALLASTLPRLSLAFAAVSALIAGAAPQFVEALAPGLPDPGLAVDCTRSTATCAFSFGLAGYCSAALRAHRRFVAPAAIYVVYNLGIVAAMFLLGGSWGVRSAAAGVALGGCLMVVVQLPSLWRQLRGHRMTDGSARTAESAESTGPTSPSGPTGSAESTDSPGSTESAQSTAVDNPHPMSLTLIATVLLFALCRQSQVLIERFLASHLSPGAISHLNYAQKVAQIPMTLSLMLCTVTFPVVARALAEGDTERARTRVERDLALAACLVLLGGAVVVACAPQIVELLFQRGAFTARDTAATADVMRVYALGLLGQTLVGALVRSYFSAGRATWYPAGAMAAGIVVTSWISALSVGVWGVTGIAAGNAAGITATAALLLYGLRGTGPHGAGREGRAARAVPIRTRRVLGELSRPLRAAVVATVAGASAAHLARTAPAGLALGATTTAAVFVLLCYALGAEGCTPALRSVRTVTQRLTHGLFR
ncbi:murein biosynthesis integral membrane protein MurJ [Streptomyces sp. NPDC006012]|uniref:murein biosynthesis integral membrane protein MurJ n=1 Tax=Streptomyces sp. NPDC006012 TaxID=3364739 RepID=UPI0036BF991E